GHDLGPDHVPWHGKTSCGVSTRRLALNGTGRHPTLGPDQTRYHKRPRSAGLTPASVRHPAPVIADGYSPRQVHDGHRLAGEVARVEDDEVAAVLLAVVAQREHPPVGFDGVGRLRDEHWLAGDVAGAEVLGDR